MKHLNGLHCYIGLIWETNKPIFKNGTNLSIWLSNNYLITKINGLQTDIFTNNFTINKLKEIPKETKLRFSRYKM